MQTSKRPSRRRKFCSKLSRRRRLSIARRRFGFPYVRHSDRSYGYKMPLDFWTVVTKGFSSLGPRAEWRIARVGKSVVPVALIVRVNVSGETVTGTATSYLAVTKISGEQSCVVARIPSAATSNADARKAADAAAAMSCLTQVE